jgi:small subunit ribosomal protein S21|tara:strand:- start:471 stop:665 length:195 start_codon:yes stop_codon:yes gene_type:complete
MPGIYVGTNENLENALRRFKRQVEKGGVLSDAKRKEYFEKPSETKKKKLFAAKKRINKKKRISK